MRCSQGREAALLFSWHFWPGLAALDVMPLNRWSGCLQELEMARMTE